MRPEGACANAGRANATVVIQIAATSFIFIVYSSLSFILSLWGAIISELVANAKLKFSHVSRPFTRLQRVAIIQAHRANGQIQSHAQTRVIQQAVGVYLV